MCVCNDANALGRIPILFSIPKSGAIPTETANHQAPSFFPVALSPTRRLKRGLKLNVRCAKTVKILDRELVNLHLRSSFMPIICLANWGRAQEVRRVSHTPRRPGPFAPRCYHRNNRCIRISLWLARAWPGCARPSNWRKRARCWLSPKIRCGNPRRNTLRVGSPSR